MPDRSQHRRRFSGRDPDEGHRASTPLELLYDLTIVVGFGTATDQLAHRERSFPFGYGHLAIFAPLAAMGGGLHVAAYELEGEAAISSTATVLSVAIPFAIYAATLYFLYSVLMRARDPFHLGLVAGTAAVLALVVILAAAGASVAFCLLVLTAAPAVTVVGYETLGHRHIADALERL